MIVHRFNGRPKRTIDKVITIGSAVTIYSIVLGCIISLLITDIRMGIFISLILLVYLMFFTDMLFNAYRGYIEIQNDTVRVVCYRCFMKQEKFVSLQDIAYTIIRYNRGSRYILFKNQKKKTLFHVYDTPQTQEFFKEYLNTNK